MLQTKLSLKPAHCKAAWGRSQLIQGHKKPESTPGPEPRKSKQPPKRNFSSVIAPTLKKSVEKMA
jgi:hypothetical protein